MVMSATQILVDELYYSGVHQNHESYVHLLLRGYFWDFGPYYL